MSPKKERKALNSREKSLLIVVSALLIVVLVKSFFFTEYRPINAEEKAFKIYVDQSVEEKYGSPLTQFNLVVYRPFNVFVAEEGVKSEIEYRDPDTGKTVKKTLDNRYTAQVRGYILGVIPFKTFAVTTAIDKKK